MHARSAWGLLVLLGIVGAFVLPVVLAATPAVPPTSLQLGRAEPAPNALGQPTESLYLNWAGYAANTSTPGAVTKVSGTWIEPAVTCTAPGNQYSVFWVGIDGFTSYSVEQTGTYAICFQGTAYYYAWWELYPTNDIQIINTFSIAPGDVMHGTVVYHPATQLFTMTLRDLTNGGFFSVTATQAPPFRSAPFMQENSAECVIERPAFESDTGHLSLGRLADFGTVDFSACLATINGSTAGIGNFSPSWIMYMVTLPFHPRNIVYLATPGGPTNLNTWGFNTTWDGYGTRLL